MRKKSFILLLCLFATFFCEAQKNTTYKTTLVDAFGNILQNANATIFSLPDSVYITLATSSKKGLLEFSLAKGAYFIAIAKDSFKTKLFTLDSTKQQLPDTIFLEKLRSLNEEVTVYASPIIIKEDTIQFNNELFKKDSIKTLEEVLRKIPGVTIDREGNIEINGIRIQELLLDGKPLPTNDIKQLTQTLQAGLIDKIQFIDRKTEETRITKIDNGVRDKVINIKLKGKTKQSWNQDYHLGYGTNKRFETRANSTYIYNDWYNNSNITYNNSGRSDYSNINFYNPDGISTGLSAFNNIRYTGYKKWNMGVNLKYSNQQNLFDEFKDRVIFLTDSLNYFQQKLTSDNSNNTFSVNSNITFTPDTLGEWRLVFNSNKTLSSNDRLEEYTTTNSNKFLTNKGTKGNEGDIDRFNINATITGGRRLRSNKFSVTTNLNFSYNNDDNQTLQSNNIVFFRSTGNGYDTTKQLIKNFNKSTFFRAGFTTNTKIYKSLRLSIGGAVNYTNRPTTRNAYFFNYATKEYSIINSALYNDVLNTTNLLTQTIGISYNIKGHNFGGNINFNQQINKNKDYYRDTLLLQNNRFYTPNFNYNFFNAKYTISQYVNINQRTPTTQQLQPIVDNSNPLFIRKGNPNLKIEQTFTSNTNFSKKNSNSTNKIKKGLTFNFSNNLTLTKNRIANNTFFDALEGKQVSQPINLPNVFNNSTTFNINQYIEKHKLNIKSSIAIRYSKDNNFLNGALNKLTNVSIRPSIGIKVNQKKFFFDYAVGYLYQTNTYSLRPNQNIKLGNFTTDASATLQFIKNWEVNIDYQQTVNNNARSIQRINNLNTRIAYTPKWKKPKITFALQAFDILNQNSNLRQNITDYYEEFVYTNAVRRYFMLSVLVRFNKFKVRK